MNTSQPIGFICIEDCTLDSTNFYEGEIIEIPIEPPSDWKGTVFYESHPQIFKPIYVYDPHVALQKRLEELEAALKEYVEFHERIQSLGFINRLVGAPIKNTASKLLTK